MRERVHGEVGQRPTAEQGLAVGAALVVHRFAVGEVQAGEPGEFGGLIDAAGACGFLVNLLERDDVGTGGGDHAGETDEVEFAVHPFAVVDIVGENAERRDRGRRFGGGKGPDRVEADRDPHEEGAKEHMGNARC